MEIMGLVIIVILISLGLLFAIQFIVLRKPADAKGVFTQKEMTSNTLNSLALSTTTCSGLDMTELVQECAVGSTDIDCSGKNPCDFLKMVAGDVFSKTLKVWGKNYAFFVLKGKEKLVVVENKGCAGTKDTSVYPIPAKYGGEGVVMRLEVC